MTGGAALGSVASRTTASLFPKSYPFIRVFTAYKEKLLLEVAREMSRTFLESGKLPANDLKVILMPTHGKKTSFIFPSIYHDDILGIKLIEGQKDGQPLTIASMRLKKSSSAAQKGIMLEGGAPILSVEIHDDTLDNVDAALKLAAKHATPAQAETLARIRYYSDIERAGREKMLLEACGQNADKVKQAKGIIAKIGELSQKLESEKSKIGASLFNYSGKADLGSLVWAAESWPFYGDQQESKAFFESLSPESQAYLGKWSRTYALETLPKVFGVSLLEHTALDSMSYIQSMLRLIHSNATPFKETALLEKISQFDDEFVQLAEIVRGVSKEQDELMLSISAEDSGRWFSKLCSLGGKRKKMLSMLQRLEGIVGCIDHVPPYSEHIKKMLSNMGVNLCRISGEEADLWASALLHIEKDFKSDSFAKNSHLAHVPKGMRNFIKAAKNEAKASGLASLRTDIKADRDRFKKIKASIDKGIILQLNALNGISPVLTDIIQTDMNRAKSHIGYKQGERLSPSIMNHVTRLRIAEGLAQGATGEKKAEYAALTEKYLLETAELFAALWGDKDVQTDMARIMKPARHIQTKAFDIVGDPQKHIAEGNTHTEIVARYEFYSEGGQKYLGLSFEGMRCSIPINTDQLYDAGHVHASEVESQKQLIQDVYGKERSLQEIVPEYRDGVPPSEFFRKLYGVATNDAGWFNRTRDIFLSTNYDTPQVLSSLSKLSRNSGVAVSFGGRIIENKALKIDPGAANELKEFVNSAYPGGYEEGYSGVMRFAYQQIARRMVWSLTINKPYLMGQMIKSAMQQ